MTNNTHWKREVRHIYLTIVRDGGIADISELIRYYEVYNNLSKTTKSDNNCPKAIKAALNIDIKMPKYLHWAKQYLVKK